MHEPPSALVPKVAGLPSEVEHVLLRALAKNKSDRFASVSDFALALERASAVAVATLVGRPQILARPAHSPDAAPSRPTTFTHSTGELDDALAVPRTWPKWILATGAALVLLLGAFLLLRPGPAPKPIVASPAPVAPAPPAPVQPALPPQAEPPAAVDHPIQPRQVPAADPVKHPPAPVAGARQHALRVAGVEQVFGRVVVVFGFVVEEFRLGADAHGVERGRPDDADGQLVAVDKLLDECAAELADDLADHAREVRHRPREQHPHAAALVDRLDDDRQRDVRVLPARERLVVPGLEARRIDAGADRVQLGGHLVHCDGRRARTRPDEWDAALFEQALQRAVFAERTVQGGEHHVGGMIEGREVVGADVGDEDVVSALAQRVGDGAAGVQADFALRARSAAQDGDTQMSAREGRSGSCHAVSPFTRSRLRARGRCRSACARLRGPAQSSLARSAPWPQGAQR